MRILRKNGCVFVLLFAGFTQALASTPEVISYPSVEGSPAWASADFNGDSRSDLVTATELGYRAGSYQHRLELKLSGSGQTQVWPVGLFQDGLSISPEDIDDDGDLDLVFENLRWRTSLSVWRNDGSGRFEQIPPELFGESLIWGEPGVRAPSRGVKPIHVADGRRITSHGVEPERAVVDFDPGSLLPSISSNTVASRSPVVETARGPPQILS
jgi:hypothetical protein